MLLKVFQSIFFLIIAAPCFGSLISSCIIQDHQSGEVLYDEGDCQKSYSPYSSFKVPLCLMGLDQGILENEDQPKIPFEDSCLDPCPDEDDKNFFKQIHGMDMTPRTWLYVSGVWYSWFITSGMNEDTIQNYLRQFDYGNKDFKSDIHTLNNLTHGWLNGSLKISTQGQVDFLNKLIHSQSSKLLGISARAITITRDLMRFGKVGDLDLKPHQPTIPQDTLPEGWTLYGKTGGGSRQGWFIGWIEKGTRQIVFAYQCNTIEPFKGTLGRQVALPKTLEKLSNEIRYWGL